MGAVAVLVVVGILFRALFTASLDYNPPLSPHPPVAAPFNPFKDVAAAPPPAQVQESGEVVGTPLLVPGSLGGVPALLSPAPKLADASGAVFLFHGCSHTGEVWRLSPKERQFVTLLEAANLYVIALTATGAADSAQGGGCWDLSVNGEDLQNTLTIARALRASPGSADLPFLAVGASSGGAFVGLLASVLKLHAGVPVIAALHGDLMRAVKGGVGGAFNPKALAAAKALLPEKGFAATQLPRLLLLQQPKDTRTSGKISSQLNDLADAKVVVAPDAVAALSSTRSAPVVDPVSTVNVLAAYARPLLPTSLSQSMPSSITPAASSAFVAALKSAGLLRGAREDEPPAKGGGYLSKPSRSEGVKAAVAEFIKSLAPVAGVPSADAVAARTGVPELDVLFELGVTKKEGELVRDARAQLAANVGEVLNDLDAVHEMTSQHAELVVAWMVQGL